MASEGARTGGRVGTGTRALAIVLPLFVFFLLLAPGCGGGGSEESGAEGDAGPATVGITNSGGQRVEVRAEIADELPEQTRGLMERTALAEDSGMLFVYTEEEPRSFWMRNTLIPLSIAYIDEDGRIVDIQDMEPLDETPHPSAEPAQYALEVNQGFFEERGIEVGDTADLPA